MLCLGELKKRSISSFLLDMQMPLHTNVMSELAATAVDAAVAKGSQCFNSCCHGNLATAVAANMEDLFLLKDASSSVRDRQSSSHDRSPLTRPHVVLNMTRNLISEI